MRRALDIVGLALVLLMLAWPSAGAEYRGSDLLGNIGPESQVAGGLADRYPLSAYSLDYHVDVGVTDPEGIPPMLAQWASAQIWSATTLLVKCTIDLFTWAFSLDLLNGSSGALAPIGDAITSLYENVIGEAWMVVAILIAGLWGIWKALVQRRYTETAGALATSVVFVVIALFFVYQPQRTIGQASQWTNTLSQAFLSGTNRGSLDDPEQAKRQVADHLFETLVIRPWAVLEFGGLEHCVDTDSLDQDGFPRPVSPHDPARDVCRDHLKVGKDGHGGYAPRFLKQRPGSKERKAEYDALREGQVPPLDRQFTGYEVDKADAPAVDAMQAGEAYQRLPVAILVFCGALGAVVLLGFLSLAVILAQVVALVLLGFAPVALIVGIFPGAGHAVFRNWLAKLATAVFIKVLYSLVIAVVVAVSAALTASTGSLGFLWAFLLQTIFFWAIFVYRKQITNRLVSATTGAADSNAMPRMTTVQRGANAAARPFTALAATTRSGARRQASVLVATSETATPKASKTATAATSTDSSTATPAGSVPSTEPAKHDAAPHRPTIDERPAPISTTFDERPGAPKRVRRFARVKPGAASPVPPPVASNGLPAADHATAQPATATGASNWSRHTPARAAFEEPSPRDRHEDVMRRARELRERQRETGPSESRRD